MNLKECYVQMGSDYEEVFKRLKSNELIQKYALKFLDDQNFKKLSQSLKSNNVNEAFLAAHTLKGICANLGFSALFNSTSEITEMLRSGDISGALLYFKTVESDYSLTVESLKTLEK